MKSKLYNFKRVVAFTLVELIIVIAVITILAGIVIVAINPAAIFANARNGQRANDLSTIQAALTKYIAESPVTASAANTRTLGNTITNYGTSANTVAGAGAANTLITGPCGTGSAASSNASCTAGSTSGITVANALGGAYSNVSTLAACPGGSNGTGLIAGGTLGYSLQTAAVSAVQQVDLTTLVNAGYLPKVPKDPQATAPASGYRICIDTLVPTNPNSNLNPGKLVIHAPGVENGAAVPYVVI